MKALSLSTFAALALAVCGCNAEDKAKPVNDPKSEDLTKLSKEELAKKLDKEAYYVCIMAARSGRLKTSIGTTTSWACTWM